MFKGLLWVFGGLEFLWVLEVFKGSMGFLGFRNMSSHVARSAECDDH